MDIEKTKQEKRMHEETKVKGAFKNFPMSLQPKRIPLDVYDDLAKIITDKLQDYAEVFIPSTQKAVGKIDTGDIDVIINPINRETWREDFKEVFKDYIIAEVSNGPQLMTVMNKLDGNPYQYMVDFILAKEGSFEYRKKYSQFGTIIPAVVGSFARSLRYKFDQNGLYLRLLSKKGNYHNILLTSDFAKAMQILMLDLNTLNMGNLYTAEQVAQWIIDSPRFDTEVWRKPPSPDGQTIVTKNVKSHRAAKSRPQVKECYQIVDNAVKKASWNNTGYKIERLILGDKYIDTVLEKVNDIEKKQEVVISGIDVMEILEIKPGPEIGKYLKEIQSAGYSKEEAVEYLKGIKNEKL